MPRQRSVYVLVADLAASRSAPRRPELARTIGATLRAAARQDGWEAPPVTVRGIDEISAILRRPALTFDFAVALNLAVWPQTFRLALSAGGIDVASRSRDAGAADGPAFHRAAEALERARREELTLAVSVPGLAEDRVRMIEALARLHGSVLSDATAGGIAVLRAVHARPDDTQSQLARRLGLTQQAVSSALRRVRASELAAAEEAIRFALATLPEPPPPE